ncbi:hypothetical protein EVAR_69043_1 [Eumeta japonica]|uniref:Uncharacterized protein n=1 Tax=Eumeta variegata TaxID=151549 RepID=A0A4C1ZHB0_EUMVA|nr:hypothetical protein EVAR_69043_1 [Eumeta japonica]
MSRRVWRPVGRLSFKAAGRHAECGRVTCYGRLPESSRERHREPSRVGSVLLPPPGAVCGSRWSKEFSGWEAAADSQPPLEGAHWDVIPRCRKIASMRPSCTLIRWGVRGLYVELNYARTNVHP